MKIFPIQKMGDLVKLIFKRINKSHNLSNELSNDTSNTFLKIITFFVSIIFTAIAYSNPQLNNVEVGNVSVQQTPNSTIVHQSSDKAIINWNSFNINSNESTHFQQPAGGIALNRISPTQGASSIYGSLTATGQIILVNPAGIYFGPGAYVDVGGLIATTTDISNQNFLNGNYIFNKISPYENASIINAGTIIAHQHGLVALVGSNVQNNGLIQAHLGHVVLASGGAFTISFAGNSLINFDLNSATAGRVVNRGSLIADGGTIMVSASAARNVLDNVINLEGHVQAQTVQEKSGEIILLGPQDEGIVRVAADINVTGKGAGQIGGKVKLTGNKVLIDNGSKIDVSGDHGGGDIYIGGNYQGKGPLANATATVVAPNTFLLADAITAGNGGNIILWSQELTKAYGTISARGGALIGNGGFIETSSHNLLDISGIKVDTSAAHGETGQWLLDPYNVTISSGSLVNGAFDGGDPTNTFTPSATGSNVNTLVLESNLNATNVTINTGSIGVGADAGNITVMDPINWTSNHTLKLQAINNIIINASITAPIGTLQLSAANIANSITTGASGAINVYNFNLLQGQWTQVNLTLPDFNVTNNFSYNYNTSSFIRAIAGTGATFDPYYLTDIYGVQGIGSSAANLAKSYTIFNNIDASVTSNWNSGRGFIPIGDEYGAAAAYSGVFNGNNNTISNLMVNTASGPQLNSGLFGHTAGAATIKNITLANANISGYAFTETFIGALIGHAVGNTIIDNVAVINSTIASPIGGYVGGLFGVLENASVTNARGEGNTVTSTGPAGTNYVGGLVGFNYASSITSSFVLGGIVDTNINSFSVIGGFAGINDNSSITDSFSTAYVRNTGASGKAAGFVGENLNGSIINRVYSSGAISNSNAPSATGGLVGTNTDTVSNSFWDVNTTGIGTDGSGVGSAGGTGKSTANMMTQSTFSGAGWDFSVTPVWGILASQSYPFTKAYYTSNPRVISGSTPLASNNTVNLAVNGANLVSNYVGVNGSYYMLFKNGSLANGTPILLYMPTGNANIMTLAPAAGGSLTNLNLTSAGMLTIGDSNSNSISNTHLSTAVGSLTGSGLLYSASGSDITLNSGIDLATTATTTLNIDGNITTDNADQTYNGNVSAVADSILTTGGGNAIFNGTINSATFPPSSLTVSAGTGDITFNGAVGGSVILNSLILNSTGTTTFNNVINAILLSTNAGGSTVINTNGINTVGDQTFNDAVRLKTDVNFNIGSPTNYAIFNSTLDSFDSSLKSLSVNSRLTFNGVVGGNFALNSITTNTNGFTTINTSSVTTANAQTYNRGVYLGADTVLNTTNSDVTFGSWLESLNATPRSLTINSGSGTITFNNTLGAFNALGSLVLNTNNTSIFNSTVLADSIAANLGGTTHINSNNITTTGVGGQVYSGNVILGSDTTLNANAGPITFTGTLNSDSTNRALVLNNSGDTTFNNTVGAVSALSSLQTDAGGNTNINTTTLNTIGAQTYGDAVKLGANAILSTNNANVTFQSTLDSNAPGTPRVFAINAGSGDILFSGAIGQTSANLMTLNSTGTTTFDAPLFAVSLVTNAGGSTIINTNTITNTTNPFGLTFNDAVKLKNDVTFNGNIINFNSTLDSFDSTPHNIVSNALSRTTFGNDVGSSFRLGTITVNAGTGFIQAKNNIKTIGSQFYHADLQPTGNVSFDSSAGDILFGARVESSTPSSFTATANNGSLTFFGALGALTTITDLIANAAQININTNTIKTSTTQQYNGAVLLGQTTDLTSGSIDFSSTIDSDNVLTPRSLTLTYTNHALFNGNIGAQQPLISLTLTPSGGLTTGTQFNGVNQVTTNNNQNYHDSVTLSNHPITFTSNTGNIIFDSNVTGSANNSVTINNAGSGSVVTGLLSNVSLNKAGAGILTLLAANTYSGNTNINAGTLRAGTANAFSANSNVILADVSGAILDLNSFDNTIASLSGGGVNGGNVLLSGNLTTSNSSNTTYSGNISGSGSLSKFGSGTFTLAGSNNYTGNTTINAGTLRAGNTNAFSSSSNVLLADVAGATLDLNNFDNTIQSLSGGGASGGNLLLNGNLTTGNSSNTTYNGHISGSGSLTKVGTGTFTLTNANAYTGLTHINNGILTITNAQSLGALSSGAIVNSGATLNIATTGVAENISLNDATLESTGNASLTGAIALGGSSNTINNSNAGTSFNLIGNIDGATHLTFQGAGNITLQGSIGTSTPVLTLTTTGNTTILGSIGTVSSQTYGSALTLSANTSFTSTGGNITFNNTIDGAYDLSVTSAGTITFANVVGGTPLNSLTVNASTIDMNGGSVSTTGSQTYNGVVSLGADTNFTVNGGSTSNITFNNGISGNKNVTLTGNAANNNWILNGSLAVHDLTVSNSIGSSNNQLTVDISPTQNWFINGVNSGNSNIGGVSGNFNFDHIHHLIGGSGNDVYTLMGGGSITGGIDGGSGTNTLTANNVANTWNITGSNSGTVTGLGTAFSNIQNLVGGSNNDVFTLAGGTLAGSLNGGGGINTLVANNTTNTWNITGADAGSLTGTGGFADIQNLIGGSGNDSFTIAGGNLSGNIDGGAGSNTLAADNGVNLWNIAGIDTGSVNGLAGIFSNIQNLTGGNQDNTYAFANNAKITGYISGGSLSATNTLDYSAYLSPVNIVLSNTNDGSATASSSTITNFGNINNLIVNDSYANMITLPNKTNSIVVTDKRIGYINDPIYFNGFTIFNSVSGLDTLSLPSGAIVNLALGTVTIDGVTMSFFNFDLSPYAKIYIDVSSIIQQPISNADSESESEPSSLPAWATIPELVTNNVNDTVKQFQANIDNKLNKTVINPYCTGNF